MVLKGKIVVRKGSATYHRCHSWRNFSPRAAAYSPDHDVEVYTNMGHASNRLGDYEVHENTSNVFMSVMLLAVGASNEMLRVVNRLSLNYVHVSVTLQDIL